MALLYGGNTSTTTASTFTTSGTSDMYWMDADQRKLVKRGHRPHTPPHQQGRLVTRVPFKVETGGSLLSSLQREFDRWAKPQMQVIHG